MFFFSLVFILLKLKINFGRVTRGCVLAKKKQFSLEVSGRFLTSGEEEIMEQKRDDSLKKGQFIIWLNLGCFSRGWRKAHP